jgi:hypothetical protein
LLNNFASVSYEVAPGPTTGRLTGVIFIAQTLNSQQRIVPLCPPHLS